MVMGRWLAFRRWLRRHVLLVDAALAVALGSGAAVGSADAVADAPPGVTPTDWLGFGLVGVTAAGLVVRRRSPVVAFAVSSAATLVYLALRYPYSPILQLATVALYSVAAWRPLRTSAVCCLAALGSICR